jgi:hypothetical protein
MRFVRVASILSVTVGLYSTPCGGIIRRHDVPDLKYQEYGRLFRGPIVNLGIPNANGAPQLHNGMGVLIAPRWVLTAAHAAEYLKPGCRKSRVSDRHSVYVGGLPRLVDGIVIFPGADRRTVDEDIALIRLKEPVAGVSPVGLYREKDELGKKLIVAGYGRPGTGRRGVAEHDAVLRAANVTVDNVDPGSIAWTFRSPNARGVHPLEGISGPGDSGGPALIEKSGKLYVVGVSSTQDKKGQAEGTYGVVEYYARVSASRPWLEKTMSEHTGSSPINAAGC